MLQTDIKQWSKNPDYNKGLSIFKELQIVNDTAERAVYTTEKYINVLTKDEEQKQYLMQAVTEYKQQYKSANKCTVTKKFKKDD